MNENRYRSVIKQEIKRAKLERIAKGEKWPLFRPVDDLNGAPWKRGIKKDEDWGGRQEPLYFLYRGTRKAEGIFALQVTVCTVRATRLICTHIGDPPVIPQRWEKRDPRARFFVRRAYISKAGAFEGHGDCLR